MAFLKLPQSARRSFSVDITSGIFLAMGGSMLGLTAAVLRKTLVAPEWLVTALMMVQTGVLVASLAWAGASRERRKVPLIVNGATMAGCFLIATGIAAWAIPSPGSGVQKDFFAGATPLMLAFSVLSSLAFLAQSGFNALIAAVFRDNYPVQLRARIVSVASIPKLLAGMILGVTASVLLDQSPRLFARLGLDPDISIYQWLLVFGGLMYLAGGQFYRRMPHVDQQAYEPGVNWRQLGRAVGPMGLVALVRRKWRFLRYLVRWSFARVRNVVYFPQFLITPRGIMALMRRDRHFARFELLQTLHGSGNLVCGPAYLFVMTDLLKLDYFNIVMLGVVPLLVQTLSTVAWAPLVDRVSPSRGRFYNSPFWVIGLLLFPLSAVGGHELWVAYVARFFTGLAMGGSSLMWTLGPLYYARRHNSTEYLAAHSFLTGTRGILLTLLGGWLWHVAGMWVFAVGAAMVSVSWILFHYQDRAELRDSSFSSELKRAGIQ